MKNNREIGISLNAIAKSSIFVFIALVLSKILAYGYKIIVARSFDPSIFGLFSLSIIIAGIFASIASLGLAEGLQRFIPLYGNKKDSGKRKYIFNLSIAISLLAGIIAGTILFFSANWISIEIFDDSGLIIFLKIFSLGIPISVMSGIYLSVLRAFKKITVFSFITNVFQNIAKIIAVTILLFIGFREEAVIWSHMFGLISVLIISFWISRDIVSKINFKDLDKVKNMKKVRSAFFSYSWPIIFLGLINIFFYWTDSIVIGVYMSSAELGFYNVAFTIAALFSIAPDLFIRMFFPIIVREYSRNRMEIIRQVSKQIGKWIFILNIPLLIVIILFPNSIINVLFGAEYLPGSLPLVILAIGGFVSSIIFSVSEKLLSMKGKSKILLYDLLSIALFNLILNIILVPKYGLSGAAISTTVSWFILNIVIFIQVKINLDIFPLKRNMERVGLIAILPVIIAFIIGRGLGDNLGFMGLAIMGIFLVAFYGILLLILNGFDENDLNVIRSFKSGNLLKWSERENVRKGLD